MVEHWVMVWVARFSYPAVFGLLLAGGLGVPLSEDLVVVTGGAVIAQTHGSLPLMIAVVYLGKLSGDFCLFQIGWKLGPRATENRHFRKMLTPERVARVEGFFDRFGMSTVLLARFLPGLRAPTYLIAGITHFSAWKFVVADGFAAMVSAPLLTWAGYRFGAGVLHQIEHSGRWILVGVGGLAALAVAFRLWKRRRKRRAGARAARTQAGPGVHREA